MTANLNFCRQMVKQYSEAILLVPKSEVLNEEQKRMLLLMNIGIEAASKSHKFLLPAGGISCDDRMYRALDEDLPLSLPYAFIALEFQLRKFREPPGGKVHCSREIIFAMQDSDNLTIQAHAWVDSRRLWIPVDVGQIARRGAVIRSDRRPDAGVLFNLVRFNAGDLLINKPEDYASELHVLMSFLNALSCSNVRVSHSPGNPRQRRAKVGQQKLDSYRILDIGSGTNNTRASEGGSHSSPREHLRRGHVRRLQDGKHIWINAMVVAAGSTRGKIEKDYRVHAIEGSA